MTAESEQGRLDDGLTILRRVRDYEVIKDENGHPIPSSQAFIQGGPDGNVSVYLNQSQGGMCISLGLAMGLGFP